MVGYSAGDVSVEVETHRSTQNRRGSTPALFDASTLLWIFLLLVGLIPARWVVPGLGAAGRPAALFGVGLFGLWALIQLLPTVRTRPTPFRWILLLNAVVLMISYAFGQDRGLTAAESLSSDRALIQLVSLTGVILMASEGIPSLDHAHRLTRRITYLLGFIATMGVIQFLLRFDPYSVIRFPGLVLNNEISDSFGTRGTGSLVRVRSSTLHPIEFSIVMALGLPLAFHHMLHEPNRILRRRRQMLTVLLAGAAMLAVSRSAVVGLACACLVMLWGWSPKLRLAALGSTVLFLVGLRALVPGLLGTIRSLFTNLANDPSIQGRTADYDRITPYIADRPFFGRGVGTFIPDQYILLDNTYLGRLAATGYIGLAVLLVMLIAAFLMSRHCVRRSPDDQVRHLALVMMAMIFVGIIGGSTFDFLFFPTASGLFYVAMGLAAFFGTYHSDRFARTRSTPPGLLRPSYRSDYRPTPWWYRFDREMRARGAAKALDSVEPD